MNATEQATAERLRALAAAAAPASTASPDLAEQVLARLRTDGTAPGRHGDRPSRRRRLLLAAGAAGLAATLAAAGYAGRGDHREWTQPSAAMAPTVQVGQQVVVGKRIEPARGDVVLVEAKDGPATFETLGRVVGLPGDTVSCPPGPDGLCTAVTVSGEPLREPWITSPTAPFAPVRVPGGSFFFLGDARDAANDSRLLGPQSLDAVLGVVVARVEPDGTLGRLPGTPAHPVPDGQRPVDPADPVPPARTAS